MQIGQTPKKQQSIYDVVRRLISLYADNVKLTSAEKLTMLFAGVALLTIVMVLTVLAIIFIAIGLSNMLEDYIAPFWTYFIIAGVLTVIIVAVVLLKEQLIYNPIARFISRLILNPPTVNSQNSNDSKP